MESNTRSGWRRSLTAAAFAGLVATAGAVRAGTDAGAQTEEILVTGERPGPGLWRVSKADHVLWILATLEPLPKEMTWRSKEVEARIAESQAILSPPEVDFDVGFFRAMTLVPALLRAKKNADGATLEAVLPHDQYMRWLALRVKYLGRWRGQERVRPLVAARELYTHALEASGLTEDTGIWEAVKQAARRHRVPVQAVTLTMPLKDPKDAIKELAQIPKEAEIACLDATMTRVETDLRTMRERANRWSLGDIDGLTALPFADQNVACLNAFASAPKLGERVSQLEDRLSATWLAAVDRAVEQHQSSVAVVPMPLFLGADGYLAGLRRRGYEVSAP